MYPEATEVQKGVLSQAWETGKGFFNKYILGTTTAEQTFTPPPTSDMVARCLYFYLEPYRKILLNETGYPENFRVDGFVSEVKVILEQHHKPVVQHIDYPCPVTVDNLLTVRITFFLHIMEPLCVI